MHYAKEIRGILHRNSLHALACWHQHTLYNSTQQFIASDCDGNGESLRDF